MTEFGNASLTVCKTRGKMPGRCTPRRRSSTTGQPLVGNLSKVKLHQDPSQALNTVTGYGRGYVEVNKIRHDQSVIIAPEG